MDRTLIHDHDHKTLLAFRKAQKLAKQQRNVSSGSNGDTKTSLTAAFARSFVLLLGVYFKRPSRLFRPSRVDTLATLRQMALSTNQTLSPAFIRALLKDKGPRAIMCNIMPPLLINTLLGTLLFTSHSYFCYVLSRLPFFAPKPSSTPLKPSQRSLLESFDDLTNQANRMNDAANGRVYNASGGGFGLEGGEENGEGPSWMSFGAEDQIMFMESIHRLPHPTLLSALAGAGAGVLQGVAFAPIENAVKVLQRGITSWSEAFSRVFGLRFSTTSFHPLRDLNLPKSPQDLKSFLGFGEGIKKAWQGVRWAMGRDAVGYAMFFASFDVSRRVGLAVKAWLTPVEYLLAVGRAEVEALNRSRGREREMGKKDEELPIPHAPTSARIAQAACLVIGGVTASFAAEYVTRPLRKFEELNRIRLNRAPGLEFKAKPVRGMVRPFAGESLVRTTLKQEGLSAFFRNPAEMHTPLSDRATVTARATEGVGVGRVRMGVAERVGMRVKRLGWRMVGVGPWGAAFLIFAWAGGEV